MKTEPQTPEEDAKGLEQPPADIPQEDEAPPEPEPQKSDRQSFYDLDFNALDRGLTAEERQEWNFISRWTGRTACRVLSAGPRHCLYVQLLLPAYGGRKGYLRGF